MTPDYLTSRQQLSCLIPTNMSVLTTV